MVTVVNPAEAPAPIVLTTPTTVSPPTVLEALSPKPHLVGRCSGRAIPGMGWSRCEPYLIGRAGPDGSGLYHYRFRLPIAEPGVVEVTFSAWNTPGRFPFELIPEYADTQTFTLNVIGNAYQFGDVRTCRYPHFTEDWMGSKSLHNLFELDYYATMNSRVTLRLEVKRGHRWVTVKHARVPISNLLQGAERSYSPWTIRSVWAQIAQHGSLSRHQRITYQIKHGRKVLKHGFLSKRPCLIRQPEDWFDPDFLAKFWTPKVYAPWK